MQILIDIPEEEYEGCKRLGDKRDILFEAIRNGVVINIADNVISKSYAIEKIKYGINDKACFGSPLIDWAVIKFIQGLPSIGSVKEESNDLE